MDGSTDPRRDIDVINSELALADLSMVENVIARTKRKASPDELAAYGPLSMRCHGNRQRTGGPAGGRVRRRGVN